MIDQENNINENLHKKRPESVTLLALGVLSLALFSLIGLGQILSTWDFLADLLPFPLAVLGTFRLLWGGVGLIVAWSLLTGQSWAPKLTRLVSVLYVGFLWLDRLYLFNPAAKTSNVAFVAVATLLLLIFVFWVLSRQQAKIFFGVTHEQSAK